MKIQLELQEDNYDDDDERTYVNFPEEDEGLTVIIPPSLYHSMNQPESITVEVSAP